LSLHAWEVRISSGLMRRLARIQNLPFRKQKLSEGVRLNPELKRYIDDTFSLWDTHEKGAIEQFISEANRHHYSLNFVAKISEKETNF